MSTANDSFVYDLDSQLPLDVSFTTLLLPEGCVTTALSYTVFATADLMTAPTYAFASGTGVQVVASDYGLIGMKEFVYTATILAT